MSLRLRSWRPQAGVFTERGLRRCGSVRRGALAGESGLLRTSDGLWHPHADPEMPALCLGCDSHDGTNPAQDLVLARGGLTRLRSVVLTTS